MSSIPAPIREREEVECRCILIQPIDLVPMITIVLDELRERKHPSDRTNQGVYDTVQFGKSSGE